MLTARLLTYQFHGYPHAWLHEWPVLETGGSPPLPRL
jgi:hypothetical protein